jgi:hypothetical protein
MHAAPAALQRGVAPEHAAAQQTLPVPAAFVSQLPSRHCASAVHASPFPRRARQTPASHHRPAPQEPSSGQLPQVVAELQ